MNTELSFGSPLGTEYSNSSSSSKTYSNINTEIFSYREILKTGTPISNGKRDPKKFSEVSTAIDKEIKKELEQVSLLKKEKKLLNKDLEYKDIDKNRCYTCKPRGKVRKCIIGKSVCGNFIFHHDLSNRPVVMLTPIEHVVNIQDLNSDLMQKMFTSIEIFCGFWNIKDYQVSYNAGQWKSHEHFHVKIKIPDRVATKMRNDHFAKIEMEERYKK